MAHRKYGTKPAYTEASIGGSWIFYDGEEYRQSILQKTRNTILPRVAAVVHHSPLTDLKNIQINIETIDMGSSADLKVLGGGLAEAKPDFAVIINLDGSMTIDYEGLQPVDYALSGNPLAARMLKAEIAANFYDLSMPVDDSSPSTLRNYAGMSPAERQDFEPLLTLLVPRIRRLNDPRPDIVESGRTVREHDVTWFVRSLRPGWHASPVAIENARRVGIKLEPNETFVKAHKRGLGNTVLGYHAVKRSVDLAPGEDY
jgi:hypothetical protein